jgi:Mycothiol maleylpyruvate isomerase N-terminal domain
MPPLEGFVDLGAIAYGRATIRERVVRAWDDFLRVADGVDMAAKSRLPGWRAHEICVHLGAWPEHQPVNGVLAAAREVLRGVPAGLPPDPDDVNSSVITRHRNASRDDVMSALHLARKQAADYLDGDEPHELDLVPVVSTVGPLPTLTILHAQIYELAVHGLDLHALGGPAPGPSLLDSGLAALTDAAGALAARVGIASTAGIGSEVGSWAFHSGSEGWQIGRWGEGRASPKSARSAGSAGSHDFAGKLPVRVHAPAAMLLEASAGRISPLKAVVTRRLKVHGLPGLLGLAPIVETVPGIPGGAALRVAARGLAGAGGALSRLTGH